MEYRELGKTGKRVSLLSLGCMRLPDDDDEGAQVVRRAAELGINYFETSNWYCDNRSEIKVGMGLKGLRDKVFISTKSKINPGMTPDDVKRNFEESLKKLDVDRVDFYQIWDFKWDDYEPVMRFGFDTLEEFKSQGLIGHIGMTSHETNEHVITMLDTGRLESITLPYNMLKRQVEPVIEHAGERGIGVVIMVPLAGGLLAHSSDVLREAIPGKHASNAAAALRFVMSHPHVSTVPSGMTCVSDIEENVRTWSEFKPFTTEEIEQLTANMDRFQSLGQQFCTGCRYCMPCPSGVRISGLFSMRNYHKVFGMREWAEERYRKTPEEALPHNCTECGECETKCPNNIPIITQLKEVAEMFKGVRD